MSFKHVCVCVCVCVYIYTHHFVISEKCNKSLIPSYEGGHSLSSVAELDSSNETDGDSFNMTDSLTCVGCEEEIENCHCKHIMATFHQLNHQL